MTKRQGKRRKKLVDELKDRRGYCELKEGVLDRTVWRNRFVQEALDLSFDRLMLMMMMMMMMISTSFSHYCHHHANIVTKFSKKFFYMQ